MLNRTRKSGILRTMKIATHNGPFHADEVFATVVLQKIFPNAELVRSRDLDVLNACDIVYDVGGVYDQEQNRFDHHMADFDIRYENGIKLSSLGLVWKTYGIEYCEGNEKLHQLMLEKFVYAIDAIDNGQPLYDLNELDIHPLTINEIIKSFYPPYGTDTDFDRGFQLALQTARILFENLIAKYTGYLKAEAKVQKSIESSPDTRYVVLDEAMPYGDTADAYPELLYIVFPGSENNDYMIRAVAKEKDSFEVRRPFPSEWAGLADTELEQVSGVKGAKFCHKNLWLAGAYSKEAALQMLALTLK